MITIESCYHENDQSAQPQNIKQAMTEDILQIGNPILRKTAKQVENISQSEIQTLIDNLMETMLEANGVGIAAPQIGSPLAIVIIASRPNIRYPDAPQIEPIVMINPHILSHSEEIVLGEEGCLSVKETRGNVERYQSVTVQYFDRQGQSHTKTYQGFVARIIQHELDHLDGVLFVDRVASELSFSPV